MRKRTRTSHPRHCRELQQRYDYTLSKSCPRGSVSRHSCAADRLPVAVRFPAGPRVRLKTVDPPKGNGLGQKKRLHAVQGNTVPENSQPTQPNIPDPLRTNYPPTPPAIDGWLQDVQQRAILNEADNLLVDLANQFHRWPRQ